MLKYRRICRRKEGSTIHEQSPLDELGGLTARLLCHNAVMGDTSFVEVGPKGRVVIPAPIRRRLGIEQGTRLAVLVDEGAVVLVPREAIERRLHAIFKGVPSSMVQELREERMKEATAEADTV